MNYNATNQILNEEVIFYTDELNPADVYVEYTLANGAICFDAVSSRMFKAFLGYRYRELDEDAERPKFKELLEEKSDEVIYRQDNRVQIHRRVAGSLTAGCITYFLADDKWRYVIVTPEGCKITKSSELKFLKGSMDEAQVKPKKGGNYLDLILPKLNMAPDDALLFAVYIIQAFSRRSSHNAAIISSAKGTGKTTLSKMLTEIVSPTKTGVTIQPSSEDDLKTMLASTYVAAFDNTSALSATVSNILCAAITGSKAAKRKLYTNCDQVVLNLHSLIIINGIDNQRYFAAFHSDAADNSQIIAFRFFAPDLSAKTSNRLGSEWVLSLAEPHRQSIS